MSEIPYYFETPVPKYFRENGWFKNPNTRLFVMWAFERCSLETREIPHDGQKLLLKPYQFIFGRKICADELGMTEGEVRNQVKVLLNAGFIKNATNSTTKRYSIYEWSTKLFLKINNQVNNQVTTKSQPSNNHNQEDKKTRSKESHPSIPSVIGIDGQTDDFSFENKIFDIEPLMAALESQEHNINYQEPLEIVSGIFLTKEEINKCVAIKGSLELVRDSIQYILKSPKRKHEIKDWPNALATWTIKNEIKVNIQENQNIGNYLEKTYSKRFGWCCEIYKDKIKGDTGMAFFNKCGTGADGDGNEPIYISFSDGKFKEKVLKILNEKGMKKVAI